MPRDVNSTGYTFGFALVICVLCSVLLTGAAVGLKGRIDTNQRIFEQRAVLRAANKNASEMTGEEVLQDYNKFIVEETIDLKSGDPVAKEKDEEKGADDGVVPVYVYKKPGSESFILPLDGKGLWGPITGYLAIKPNGNEILGVSFIAPKETPGLGAEITNDWFTSNFANKKIFDSQGNFEGVTVAKGKLPEDQKFPHKVDGVSGATLTTDGVTEIMTDYLEIFAPYIRKKAKGGIQ